MLIRCHCATAAGCRIRRSLPMRRGCAPHVNCIYILLYLVVALDKRASLAGPQPLQGGGDLCPGKLFLPSLVVLVITHRVSLLLPTSSPCCDCPSHSRLIVLLWVPAFWVARGCGKACIIYLRGPDVRRPTDRPADRRNLVQQ